MKYKTWEQCSLQQKLERWENVIRVLRDLSPHEKRKHFDMGIWADKNACGTIACAAGHCGLDPWFRRRGFKLKFYPYEQELYDYDTETYKTTALYDGRIEFSNHDWSSSAIELFFGKRGCVGIFLNTRRRSVGTVIKEVKKFIRDLKKMPEDKVNELTATVHDLEEYDSELAWIDP